MTMTPEEALAKYNAEWPALNEAKELAVSVGDTKGAKKARQMLSWLSTHCAARFELTHPKPETCKHGQLARSCEICDLEQQLAAADALLRQTKEALERSIERMHFAEPWSAAEADIAFTREAIAAIDKELGK